MARTKDRQGRSNSNENDRDDMLRWITRIELLIGAIAGLVIAVTGLIAVLKG